VFVASYGNDANACTFGSPCKTFQQAVNVVDPGGEVTAIDSAGFGPINITKAVTITSPDGVEAGIVASAGGNAITITAGGGDDIVLRGLTLDGSDGASNGVVFNSGGSLTVANCVAQNFIENGGVTGNGILIQPTSGTVKFAITNTTVSNNQSGGILYSPPSGTPIADGIIDHVIGTNNFFAVSIDVKNTSGGGAVAAISKSTFSGNIFVGLFADTGSTSVPLTFSVNDSSVVASGVGIGRGAPVRYFWAAR
jgi:hypothetical protein